MKPLFIFLLLPAFLSAQSQFCIKNETPSSRYQYRVQYACGSDTTAMQWTPWYEIPSGPAMSVCIVDDDFGCPGQWVARSFQVRTATSNNMVTLSIPENYPGPRSYLIDPNNENSTGNIVWDYQNAARIYQ